jgi:uncharacterized Ntn-hydrolase superfamily protein
MSKAWGALKPLVGTDLDVSDANALRRAVDAVLALPLQDEAPQDPEQLLRALRLAQQALGGESDRAKEAARRAAEASRGASAGGSASMQRRLDQALDKVRDLEEKLQQTEDELQEKKDEVVELNEELDKLEGESAGAGLARPASSGRVNEVHGPRRP